MRKRRAGAMGETAAVSLFKYPSAPDYIDLLYRIRRCGVGSVAYRYIVGKISR